MSSSTPTSSEAHEAHRADLMLVEKSLSDAHGDQLALVERLRCVPRMLAAKNAQMGGILDASELEDVAQETILTIWKKRHHYEGRSSIETWVYPFCYHHLMNRIRRLGRRRRTMRIEAASGVPAEEVEDYGDVYGALDRLEPAEAEVVRMRHFDQLTFAEIGRALKLPPSTLKSRYYQGLQRLRTLLADRVREMER